MAPAIRKAQRRAAAVALLVAALLFGGPAPPAAAVGPSMQLSVGPQSVTATPGPTTSGEANFTGALDLFNNPVGSASITIDFNSNLGWTVTPPSVSIRATAAGHWEFAFTVEVPPDSNASQADTIDVVASYHVGGVTTGTESASVHAVAGGYYGVSARQITAVAPMDAGKLYWVEVDLRNDGNAPGTFTFSLISDPVYDRLRAHIQLPDNPTVPSHANMSVQFQVTPGPTSPSGHYELPVRVEVRDRTNQVHAAANFTVVVEVTNLAIYQGILPNWDMRQPYTLFAFAMVFLGIWFAYRVLVAAIKTKRHKSAFGAELTKSVRGSPLARLVGALWGKRPRRRVRVAKRPDEVAGRARAARER
jgi:hypothetical protein